MTVVIAGGSAASATLAALGTVAADAVHPPAASMATSRNSKNAVTRPFRTARPVVKRFALIKNFSFISHFLNLS
jgi:hypothetical protein